MLIHFTRLRNLETILQLGIMPRSTLVTQGIYTALFNDAERNDGCMDAVCLSISFPNYKTFYYWKQHYAEPWIVLGIDPRVLWELDCAFCVSNASSASTRNVSLDTRRQAKSLEAMFDNFLDKGHLVDRAKLSIPKNFPTNPQAEVLTFGTIPPRYIQGIYFETSSQLHQYRYRTTFNSWTSKMFVNPSYFSHRSDYRFWQRYR